MPTRRILKSVAHNLLDSLPSGPNAQSEGGLTEMMERAGIAAGVGAVELDLVERRVVPTEAATPSLIDAVERVSGRLWEMVESVGLPREQVAGAVIRAELGGQPEVALTAFRVILRDDLGHEHSHSAPASWFTPRPAQTDRVQAPKPLPDRGVQLETPVTRFLGWLEGFLPKL